MSESQDAERSANALGGTADMYVAGQSDELVVLTTQANKRGCDSRGRSLPREGVRPRGTRRVRAWPDTAPDPPCGCASGGVREAFRLDVLPKVGAV